MPKKTTGETTALANWDERLAALAGKFKKTTESIQQGGMFISFKSGQMKWKDNPIPHNQLDAVVLGYIAENTYHLGKFDPDNPTSPICFALGEDRKLLVPHPEAEKPQVDVAAGQTCQDCEWNKFQSADNGKGKACQNRVRIAVISAAALKDPASIATTDVAYIRMPVTSVQAWGKYANQIVDLYNAPFFVVTRFALHPHDEYQFTCSVDFVSKIDDRAAKNALLERAEKIDKEIYFAYPKNAAAPAGKAPKKGPAKKVTGKKKF